MCLLFQYFNRDAQHFREPIKLLRCQCVERIRVLFDCGHTRIIVRHFCAASLPLWGSGFLVP
nr:MAG TPA: hypothetical protein [Caudoviricetes sp.]